MSQEWFSVMHPINGGNCLPRFHLVSRRDRDFHSDSAGSIWRAMKSGMISLNWWMKTFGSPTKNSFVIESLFSLSPSSEWKIYQMISSSRSQTLSATYLLSNHSSWGPLVVWRSYLTRISSRLWWQGNWGMIYRIRLGTKECLGSISSENLLSLAKSCQSEKWLLRYTSINQVSTCRGIVALETVSRKHRDPLSVITNLLAPTNRCKKDILKSDQ